MGEGLLGRGPAGTPLDRGGRGTLPGLVRQHRVLVIILAGHALVWALTVGRGSYWSTLSVDCVAGAVGECMLGEPAWGPWSVIDGLVGGQVIYATVALPFYALLGTAGGMAGKLAAWLVTVGLLCEVYAIGCRAAGRPAGALAAAGVAFAPPLMFGGSMATGNWHWSELVFEYGVALTALAVTWPRLRAPDRPVPHLGLAALGALSGLAVFNSPQSIPFVGLVWFVAALGCGPRRFLVGLPAWLLGAALGLAVPISRALSMKGASAGAPGDPPWRRLFRFDLDWTKLADLVWPELPVTLHIRESLPGLDPQVSGGLETAWVLVCWTGCLLTVVGVMERRFRKRGDGGSLVASLLPVGFTLAFAASYLALEVKIRIADPAFSEYRQASHRILPPLLVAMAVGAAPGWVWLCRRWGDLSLRGVRRPLQALTVLVALAPASIGLLSQAHIAAQAPGRGDAGFDIYRGSCFDPSGFFHVGHHRDRAGAEAHCSTLSSPEREQECLVGVAMGLGFYGARLGGPGEWPDDRGDDPCDHAPPDFARRCSSWSPAESPDLGPELEEICRSVHPSLRAACFRGAGWYSSQVVWGGDLWPIAACDALAEEADRVSCWGGPGFQLGDHMGHTPGRIADLLERVPAHRRDAVARGVGLAQGTQWSAEHIAHGVCDALGADLAAACKLGVADGRGYAHPR